MKKKNEAYFIMLVFNDFLTKLSLNSLAVHTIFRETRTGDGKPMTARTIAFYCG